MSEVLSDNQEISSTELQAIRLLGDFDLTMILSEIHDHGWPVARRTLQMALVSIEKFGPGRLV